MEEDDQFYTQNGYRLQQAGAVTDTMEDYLEMICRCAQETGYVRMNHLAKKLHVRPSSASKMVVKLRELGYVSFERYGLVTLTEEGDTIGRALLRRHDILHRFFCLLNGSQDELEQVEQVEHFIHPNTLDHLELLTRRLEDEQHKKNGSV